MNSRRTAQAKQESAGRALPTGYLVARFIRFYGMAAWTNPAYPTRDQHIPFGLFYAMLVAMANVSAAERFEAYIAALLAGAMIHGGEDGKASRDREVEQLLATAYPEALPQARPEARR